MITKINMCTKRRRKCCQEQNVR